MAINQNLTQILAAQYGKDVRQAIHDGIEECYDDVSTSKTLADAAATNANEKATLANTKAGLAQSAADAANAAASSVVGDISNINSQLAESAINAQNLVPNSGFSNGTTGWVFDGASKEVVDNKLRMTATSTFCRASVNVSLIAEHKYYLGVVYKKLNGAYKDYFITSQNSTFAQISFYNASLNVGDETVVSTIITPTITSTTLIRMLYPQGASIGDSVELSYPILIDLTVSFGAGNEPNLDLIKSMLSDYPNSWFDGVKNFASASKLYNKSWVVDDRVGLLEAEISESRGSESRLSSRFNQIITGHVGKNLFDFNSAFFGLLEYCLPGTIQTYEHPVLGSQHTYKSQMIPISLEKDYTILGFRKYSFVDADNIVVKLSDFQDEIVPLTILKETIPISARYLCVSAKEEKFFDAQVEEGTVATEYEDYSPSARFELNGKDYSYFKDMKDDSSIVGHQLAIANQTISELQSSTKILTDNLSSIMNFKSTTEFSQQTITLNNQQAHKLILHLHNYENEGYDTQNDVYLPHVRKDFSDIRIKTNDGTTLPYRMNYNGNIDIVADSRLGQSSPEMYLDSNGNVIASRDGKLSISSDGGRTWAIIPSTQSLTTDVVAYVTKDDTILFSTIVSGPGRGYLYRTEYPYTTYSMVLDTTNSEIFTGCYVNGGDTYQHPDGDIFFGAYQLERHIRVFKSVDDGLTWSMCYEDATGKYQHVHSVSADPYVTPIAIYVGCDGGGGMLKTTDKGLTWVDLRTANPLIPQSTDHPTMYADPSGYRLTGGETAIVGGHSILKTTDDFNFIPVLSIGNHVYRVDKIGGILYAVCSGSNSYKSAQIYISHDEGDTWKQVYMTAPILDLGASDGFRYITKVSANELIVGGTLTTKKGLRILSNSNSYAEILVDVPQGTTSITVESGYLCSNKSEIFNACDVSGTKVVNFDLNENGIYVKENVSGKVFLLDEHEYRDTGKRLSYYNENVHPKDRSSILLSSLNKGFDIEVDLGVSDGFIMSFWGTFNSTSITLLESTDARFALIGGQFWGVGGKLVRYGGDISPNLAKVFAKYDLVFDAVNNQIRFYTNGFIRGTSDVSLVSFLDSLSGVKLYKFLKSAQSATDDCIQHFSIIQGIQGESEIYNSFHGRIDDNV